MDLEYLEHKRKAALYFKDKHLFDFVEVTMRDDSKAMGTFTEVTPMYDLYLKGKPGYATVCLDPLEIKRFFVVPKRNARGDQNNR